MKFRDGHILPTVRIQKIELENFKSVHYGEVLFDCGRRIVPKDTESDILGIYGQNGSGKTAVIEALAILERLMSGDPIPARYSECVSQGAKYARLTFVFDFQYSINEKDYTRTITYSFKMDAIPNEREEDEEDELRTLSSYYSTKVRVFDETISAAGLFDEKIQKKQVILTTDSGEYPIGPGRKIHQFVGDSKDQIIVDLAVNQRTAAKESRSFVFMKETMELFYKYSNNSEYFQILMELKHYARFYLYAVDTRASGMGAVMSVPLNTRLGILGLNLLGTSKMSQKIYEDLEYFVNSINTVLPALISDMQLILDHNEFVSEKKRGKEVKLLSKRNNTIIPLRDESAGIIKLISVLSLVIAAFNDPSITVAIDELDAGIYEYLLGEILIGLETYGKGQFIFTSHNLRPLEVLKKESLIFTTSNPDNRYIRLKGVGKTNNLRSLYLREILGSTQDEQIYDAAKRQRMIASFMKAGDGIAEKEKKRKA
ncbi:MAG: AAA family ATPase [Anaerolineaceae bacterium]|nr:AAA family ATPase [Anaerolineaceae bacterium]